MFQEENKYITMERKRFMQRAKTVFKPWKKKEQNEGNKMIIDDCLF